MAQLTANSPRAYDVGSNQSIGVLANASVYLGSAVGNSGGYGRQLVAGDAFLGFADAQVLEVLGTSGSLNIPLIPVGRVQLNVTGVVITSVNAAVYASDGNTFTLNSNGGVNTQIGKVVRYISSGVAIVSFNAT